MSKFELSPKPELSESAVKRISRTQDDFKEYAYSFERSFKVQPDISSAVPMSILNKFVLHAFILRRSSMF